MQMRHLAYFVEVAKWENFSKASEELYISRQALSKAIKDFEQELGGQLFMSSGNRLVLTTFGAQVLADAEKVLISYEEFVAKHSQASKAQVSVSIALAHGVQMTFDEEIFDRLQEMHVGLTFSIEETFTDEVLDLTRSRSVDIGIVGSTPDYLSDFEYTLVRQTGLWLCVPESNPLSQKSSLTLADLNGEPIVTTGKRNHLHRFFIEKCKQENVEPDIVLTTSDTTMLVRYAAKHEALCFGFPEHVAAPMPPLHGVSLIPLDIDGTDDFGTYAIRISEPLSPQSALATLWDTISL